MPTSKRVEWTSHDDETLGRPVIGRKGVDKEPRVWTSVRLLDTEENRSQKRNGTGGSLGRPVVGRIHDTEVNRKVGSRKG